MDAIKDANAVPGTIFTEHTPLEVLVQDLAQRQHRAQAIAYAGAVLMIQATDLPSGEERALFDAIAHLLDDNENFNMLGIALDRLANAQRGKLDPIVTEIRHRVDQVSLIEEMVQAIATSGASYARLAREIPAITAAHVFDAIAKTLDDHVSLDAIYRQLATLDAA